FPVSATVRLPLLRLDRRPLPLPSPSRPLPASFPVPHFPHNNCSELRKSPPKKSQFPGWWTPAPGKQKCRCKERLGSVCFSKSSSAFYSFNALSGTAPRSSLHSPRRQLL